MLFHQNTCNPNLHSKSIFREKKRKSQALTCMRISVGRSIHLNTHTRRVLNRHVRTYRLETARIRHRNIIMGKWKKYSSHFQQTSTLKYVSFPKSVQKPNILMMRLCWCEWWIIVLTRKLQCVTSTGLLLNCSHKSQIELTQKTPVVGHMDKELMCFCSLRCVLHHTALPLHSLGFLFSVSSNIIVPVLNMIGCCSAPKVTAFTVRSSARVPQLAPLINMYIFSQ